MDFELTGKLVVVTGSTKGIGRATAEKYVKLGANVVINGRSQEVVDKVVKELQLLKNGSVYGVVSDLSTTEGANQLLSKVKEIGPIDILVNNIGIARNKSFAATSDEDWYTHFNANVMSLVRLSRAVLPEMLERNSGSIVNISSMVAFKPIGDLISYSMTKAAEVNISRGLAELTVGTKVRVNSIIVGYTQTEGIDELCISMAKEKGTTAEEVKKIFASGSLLKRASTAEEIANVVVFVSSPIASVITGSAIRADGGALSHI